MKVVQCKMSICEPPRLFTSAADVFVHLTAQERSQLAHRYTTDLCPFLSQVPIVTATTLGWAEAADSRTPACSGERE